MSISAQTTQIIAATFNSCSEPSSFILETYHFSLRFTFESSFLIYPESSIHRPQGIRYSLATCLLEERTSQAQSMLRKLLGKYPDDVAANWAYSRALLGFQQDGESSPLTEQLLKTAFKANTYIPPFLLGSRRMPPELPRYIGFGDENEAIEYVAFAIRAWTQTPGAIAWLCSRSEP